MSMTIYPAYLYKENATIEDVAKLVKELAAVKEKYIPYVVNMFLDKDKYYRSLITSDFFPDAETAYKRLWVDHDYSFRERIKKDTASYERGMLLDIMCNVVIYFHNNKIVIHGFSSIKNFFKDNFNYPDYSYYDIWACDEVTEEMSEEFSKRKEFYDSLYEKSGIPSNNGLVFDFYADDCVYDIEDQLLDGLFGKDWDYKFRTAKYNKE